MKKAGLSIIIALLAASSPNLAAQTAAEYNLRTIREGTLFGIGSSSLKDTYLSPFVYNGWGGYLLSERTTVIKQGISRRQVIEVTMSTTKNPAQNINEVGTFINYTLGYYRHFFRENTISLLAGIAPHIMGGFIYNTYNGNNPLSAKADIDLNLSAGAIYTPVIKDNPLTIRTQFTIPFAGIFFAPAYGASYYEMFNKGNTAGVVALNSFNNKFACEFYATADIPLGASAFRFGYIMKYYKTDAKNIQTSIFSSNFMVGWVKEFYMK